MVDPYLQAAQNAVPAVLLMVTYPYLPGSKSQFFQGFSVFVGALITFGATSTIGNIVSRTVLTYTRAFKIGDVVTIGDGTGVVLEKNLLVTRLLTPKNEEVSIQNGNVLSTSILNYSARAKEGLVLSVAAGIGYDVDWRKVHELMFEGRARRRTS
jgi:small-conductance mechanosensitive channel